MIFLKFYDVRKSLTETPEPVQASEKAGGTQLLRAAAQLRPSIRLVAGNT